MVLASEGRCVNGDETVKITLTGYSEFPSSPKPLSGVYYVTFMVGDMNTGNGKTEF